VTAPRAPEQPEGAREWSLRFRIARWAHGVVNGLAWRFARPLGPKFGMALRIDKSHPLWRLNDWIAPFWIDEYMRSKRQP
jgi:hypothetical protein